MNKQANSSHCFVCGVQNSHGLQMSFYETEPGEVFTTLTVPEHFQGYPGIVHGGVVASILDEATGRSFIQGDPPKFYVTARLNIRYRKPVPIGQKLVIRGHAGKDMGRIATATGEICDQNGTVLAEAEAVLSEIPPELEKGYDPAELGWKVYPDDKETV